MRKNWTSLGNIKVMAVHDKPLTGLSTEETAQTLVKWAGRNNVHAWLSEAQMRVKETASTYGLKLANRQRAVFVKRLWEVSKADEVALHCWLTGVTYRTLTEDEINRSVRRADAIGETVKAVQHAMSIWRQSATESDCWKRTYFLSLVGLSLKCKTLYVCMLLSFLCIETYNWSS